MCYSVLCLLLLALQPHIANPQSVGRGGVAHSLLTEPSLFLALEFYSSYWLCCKSQFCCWYCVHFPMPVVKVQYYLISLLGVWYLQCICVQYADISELWPVALGSAHGMNSSFGFCNKSVRWVKTPVLGIAIVQSAKSALKPATLHPPSPALQLLHDFWGLQ